MDDEIQLITDGDSLTIIGNQTAVERFLVSEGLPSKDRKSRRLSPSSPTRPESRRQLPITQPTQLVG